MSQNYSKVNHKKCHYRVMGKKKKKKKKKFTLYIKAARAALNAYLLEMMIV